MAQVSDSLLDVGLAAVNAEANGSQIGSQIGSNGRGLNLPGSIYDGEIEGNGGMSRFSTSPHAAAGQASVHNVARASAMAVAAESAHKKNEHIHQLSPQEERIMNAFEALDYDLCENKLFEREQLQMTAEDKRSEELIGWLIFFLIGAGTGTCAAIIDAGVEYLLEIRWGWSGRLLTGGTQGTTDDDSPVSAFFMDVLLCMAFVGISSGLVVWVEPAAAGSGIPDMKGYLNGTNLRATLTMRALLAKGVGVVFAVGGGLCVGKEGPLVHAGSVLAANVSHGFDTCIAKFKTWKKFRTDAHKRDFVSGGCAAGVAAAFGAPMGGVLFAFEEASSFWSLPLTWKSFFCAMTSTFTLNFWRACFKGHCEKVNSPDLITFGQMASDPYELWQLPIFIFLAVVGGLLGAVFNEINFKLSIWRRDRGWPKWKKQAECVFTAGLSATCFFLLPQIFASHCRTVPADVVCAHHCDEYGECCVSDGLNCRVADMAVGKQGHVMHCNETNPPYELDKNFDWFVVHQCEQKEGEHVYNGMASLSFTGQETTIHGMFHTYTHKPDFIYTTAECLTYMAVYLSLAVWTYGIQVPSGLFVPGIITGCSFGRLTGEWVRYVLCQGDTLSSISTGDTDGWCTKEEGGTAVRPGTYAFIGAAAMLGGMTRMTVSLCIILLETTNDIQYLLPIMLVLMVSKTVGDRFNISLYDMHVEVKCIPFLEHRPPAGMEQLHASDLMSKPVVSFNEVTSAVEIFRLLNGCSHNGFPVLKQGTRKFVGMILRSQLVVLFRMRAFCGQAGILTDGHRNSTGNDDMSDVSWFGAVQVTTDDFGTKLQSEVDTLSSIGLNESMLAGKYLDLRSVMNPRPFSVGEETSLVRVFRLCRSMGIRHLPVVNIDNEIVGILTRKELRADFSQDLY